MIDKIASVLHDPKKVLPEIHHVRAIADVKESSFQDGVIMSSDLCFVNVDGELGLACLVVYCSLEGGFHVELNWDISFEDVHDANDINGWAYVSEVTNNVLR